MKSKAIIVLILSISLTLVSCTFWISFGLSKPKPNPNSNPELIIFEGDLEGNQEVVGCCPNAGPFPEYTMTLSGPLPAGTYDGNIFMNVYGAGKNKSYIVQFWDETMFLEVIGGDIEKDNRTKTTTVMFNDEQCEVTMANVTTTFQVTFTLTRTQAQ